jgi:hypothetical protein
MSRTLTALESRGLLVSKGQGKARKLAPSPMLRACYAGADDAARRAAVATLNLDKNGHQPRQNEPTNLDKKGPEPRQSGEVDADQPRQNGSRVIGDQYYQQFTSTPPTPEEWERAQKK